MADNTAQFDQRGFNLEFGQRGFDELCSYLAVVCQYCRQKQTCPLTHYDESSCDSNLFLTYSCHGCSEKHQMVCMCKYNEMTKTERTQYIASRKRKI